MKILDVVAVSVLLMSASSSVLGDVPSEFSGKWGLSVESRPGFPWWEQIRYPTKIVVFEKSISFIDQSGEECNPDVFFYDDEIKALVFRHCLPTKSGNAFPPFYRVKKNGSGIEVEVWTFKELFKLKGKPVD